MFPTPLLKTENIADTLLSWSQKFYLHLLFCAVHGFKPCAKRASHLDSITSNRLIHTFLIFLRVVDHPYAFVQNRKYSWYVTSIDDCIYSEIIPIFVICPAHGFQSCVIMAPDIILMLLGRVTYHWVQNTEHSSSPHTHSEKKSMGRSRKAWYYFLLYIDKSYTRYSGYHNKAFWLHLVTQ